MILHGGVNKPSPRHKATCIIHTSTCKDMSIIGSHTWVSYPFVILWKKRQGPLKELVEEGGCLWGASNMMVIRSIGITALIASCLLSHALLALRNS